MNEPVRLQFVLPSLRAISAHPVRVVGTFLVLSLLTAALVPDAWQLVEWLRAFTVVGTSTVLVSAGAVRAANRLPRRPPAPRRRTARLRSPGRRPPTHLPLLVNRCVVCGRRLTDYTSQRTGVGPDCRARYGPQPQFRPNPAFREWERRRAALQREQEAEQREHDMAYSRAQAEHEIRVRAWEAEMATPRNQARAEVRTVARRTIGVDLGVVLSAVLSELVVAAVTQSDVPFLG
ncbi:DUF6011 domain-containing protein [Cellulomonas sp. 179-A 4D5 NHS]|uniref:DUF6011 domain-containing protein n=1 Tax=Cellulomonas sp. 179-A 4D5 NHS TaxID=3142378 RepID=UPI0039A07319